MPADASATPGEEPVDVLVYPTGDPSALIRHLEQQPASTGIRHNVIDFAGCIAVRAPRTFVAELRRRTDVDRVVPNPRFTADRRGDAPAPEWGQDHDQ